MTFKEFFKKFIKEVSEKEDNEHVTEEKWKLKTKAWLVYTNIEAQKKLIGATWFLVISTSILSILTMVINC